MKHGAESWKKSKWQEQRYKLRADVWTLRSYLSAVFHCAFEEKTIKAIYWGLTMPQHFYFSYTIKYQTSNITIGQQNVRIRLYIQFAWIRNIHLSQVISAVVLWSRLCVIVFCLRLQVEGNFLVRAGGFRKDCVGFLNFLGVLLF